MSISESSENHIGESYNRKSAEFFLNEGKKYYEKTIDLIKNYYSDKNFNYLDSDEFKKAKENFEYAIEHGSIDGLYLMGKLYYDINMNMNMNMNDEAKKYWIKASNNGHTDAMLSLANLYHYCNNDIVNAEKYYKKAIDGENIRALKELGNFYRILYQTENNEKVEFYLEQYISKKNETGNGDSHAEYLLGLFYRENKKDINNAKKYFEIAAKRNDDCYSEIAKRNYDELAEL
jgi:TPR repeat protein